MYRLSGVKLIGLVVQVLGFAVGFGLYGEARSMQETVFFDAASALFGALLGIVVPLSAVSLVSMARALWAGRSGSGPLLRGVGSAALVLSLGAIASEVSMLIDEMRFAREASQATAIYGRPRAWPNGGCSLVFVPGKGIHSTD